MYKYISVGKTYSINNKKEDSVVVSLDWQAVLLPLSNIPLFRYHKNIARIKKNKKLSFY